MRPFTASTAARRSPRTVPLRSIALAAAGVAAALAIAIPAAAPATPLSTKQAQAAELDRKVSELEDRYGDLQEKWRGAIVELRGIQADVKDARAKLKAARRDLHSAKGRLQERALAIYRDGAGTSGLQQVAEAGSLEDFFARLETIERVGGIEGVRTHQLELPQDRTGIGARAAADPRDDGIEVRQR